MELDQGGRRLRAALAAVLVQDDAPDLALVREWLDSWRGVGLLAVGLHRLGYDLDLRQYGDGHWRASFYVTGFRPLDPRRLGLGAYAMASGRAGRVCARACGAESVK